MATPFLAEVKIVSFNFAPKGWAMCNGQFLPINQNQALFSLLGTTYGGNGQTTFALPDMRGRVPMHVGQGHVQGERAGEQAHTLSIAEMPTHLHAARVSRNDPDTVIPGSTSPIGAVANGYRQPTGLVALTPGTITTVGGSQAHLNMQPYLVLNIIIALQGIFPSQN